MSFSFFYLTLLDSGIAAPLVGLPCIPNEQNGVSTFVTGTSSTSSTIPILPIGFGVDVQTLTEQL